MPTFKGTGLGWSFESELDDATGAPAPSGFALRKIRHDGHNFAEDIRLVGIWMTLEHVDPAGTVLSTQQKFIEVSEKNFDVFPVKTISPATVTSRYVPKISKTFDFLKNSQSGLSFADYFEDDQGNYIAYGLVAQFFSADFFAAKLRLDNCEHAGFSIEQTMLLSRYGDDPPHEPSGELPAARLHPMVAYKIIPNRNVDRFRPIVRIGGLRFDFRLHLSLDTYLDDKSSASAAGNQAGLFADTDIGSAKALLRRIGGVEGVAFYAAEKPLRLEVVAPGLTDGGPKGGLPLQRDVIGWDNVHWWGAVAPGEPLISTPGAFHAAHIHWRWGSVLSSWAGRYKASSWRRFNPGDALIDPRIPRQDVLVAVSKYSKALDPMLAPLNKLTAETWWELFEKNNTPLPAEIKNGGDLVLWYCADVHRGDGLAVEGAVFLHGVFFAHNAEPTGWLTGFGPREALYFHRSQYVIDKQRQWFRSAND